MSRANFNTWFKNTALLKVEDDLVLIRVPNAFTREWLKKKYTDEIKRLLTKHLGRVRTVEYQIGTPLKQTEALPLTLKEEPASPALATQEATETQLNPRYTFELFVVGENNKLACAAAQAVVQSPGTSYNPLFIYGGVGLGKTHLLQAIGNEALKKSPKRKVVYITSERFTSEMVEAIRNQKTKEFRDRYRQVHYLLIDDIQFLAGKEGSQEEFFHTFNALYEANRQIVITSDRSPKAIPHLEERLRSRFEWGMLADISTPDYETRLAILKSKAQNAPFVIPLEVLEFLAKSIEHNIRELEGALTRIVAFGQLNNTIPTLEEVENLVGGIFIGAGKRLLRPQEIIRTVASFYNLSKDDLLGPKRVKEVVLPRQVLVFLLRDELSLPYKEIGGLLGGRDHTTIIHDYNKVKKMILEGSFIAEELKEVKNKLYQ